MILEKDHHSLTNNPVCGAALTTPDPSHSPTFPVAPGHPDAPLEFCHPDTALDPLGGVTGGAADQLLNGWPWWTLVEGSSALTNVLI